MKKEVGVLFLHGFTGGPIETRPLYNYLNARTNWLLHSPTLTGHGIPLQLSHPYANASTWIFEVNRAYDQLAERVNKIVVVGFSMGGLLALQLAAQRRVDALILLSPAAKYGEWRHLVGDIWTKLGADLLKRPLPRQTFYHLYDYKLRNTPIRAAFHFLDVLRYGKYCAKFVHTPVCFVHGKCDGIVPFSSSLYLHRRVKSEHKQLIISEQGKHHICYSADAEGWFHELLRFIERHLHLSNSVIIDR